MPVNPQVPVEEEFVRHVNAGGMTPQDAALYSTAKQMYQLKASVDELLKKMADLAEPPPPEVESTCPQTQVDLVPFRGE